MAINEFEIGERYYAADLYSYNNDGRLAATYKYIETVGWTKIAFTYTLLGDPETKTVYPEYIPGQNTESIVFNYEYDEQGRIAAIKDASHDHLVSYTYSPISLLAQKKYSKDGSDVASVDYENNIRDWVCTIDAKVASQGTQFSENLGYSDQYNGNITSADYFYRRNDGGDETVNLDYTYDGVNRLTNVNANPEQNKYNESFDYDNVGRIAWSWRYGEDAYKLYNYETGSSRLNYISEKQSSDNYDYDDRGNMIQDNSKEMNVTWDWRDMPALFNLRGDINEEGADVKMLYDANGDRMLKIEKNATDYKAVAYAGDEIVYETDDFGNSAFRLTTSYINSASGTEGKIDFDEQGQTTNYYYLKDHLGSTRSVIAGNGEVVKADMYFAYGAKVPLMESSIPSKIRKSFTGKEFDDDGASGDQDNGMNLYYFGKRFYDPEICRWISPDPVEEFWDSYAYTHGDPINFFDVQGKEEQDAKSGLPSGKYVGPYYGGPNKGKTPEEVEAEKAEHADDPDIFDALKGLNPTSALGPLFDFLINLLVTEEMERKAEKEENEDLDEDSELVPLPIPPPTLSPDDDDDDDDGGTVIIDTSKMKKDAQEEYEKGEESKSDDNND